MSKILGAVCLLLGAAGFAWSICTEQKRKLLFLKNMKEMYLLLQSEIGYTALPLPEVFRIVGEKMQPPFGEKLLTVSSHMTLERGEDFSDIWNHVMSQCLREISLTDSQEELLLKFPQCLGMNEKLGQANALERYIEELNRSILQMEEGKKNKNKVIMSLGIAAGLFMVIILL